MSRIKTLSFEEAKKLISYDLDKLIFEPDSGLDLDFPFEIEPEDFLNFAELDLIGESPNFVNVLTNAKRAIDSSVEKVIKIFSLKPIRDNFPSKVNIVNEIGLVAPRILKKVIQNRNKIEHEYKKPTQSDAEDALDIAYLFVSSVRGTLNVITTSYSISESSLLDGYLRSGFYFYFDMENRVWNVLVRNNTSIIGEVEIRPNDSNYKRFIRLAIASDRKNEDEVFKVIRDIF